MTKLFLITLLLTTFHCLQAQKTGVELNIKGWGNDTIYILKFIWGKDYKETLDTLTAKKGKIIYYGKEQDTTEVIFFAAKNRIRRSDGKFTFPNATAIRTTIFPYIYEKINGELKDKYIVYNSFGLEVHKALASEHNQLIDLKQKIDSLYVKESLLPQDQQKEINRLFDAQKEIKKQRKEWRKEFILKNPCAQISGNYLCLIDYEDKLELETHLADKVRNGIYKNQIDISIQRAKEYMAVQEAKKFIIVGNQAPDFELTDINGNTKKLTDFRNKWVIIDFWGSWCGWCIKGFPDLKKAYAKYKDQIEIIGIACNDTETQWKAAVAQHQLPWIQLICDKAKKTPVTYAIEGYPTKIIIDPQGIIRNITSGEDPKFYIQLNELLNRDETIK